MPESLHLLFYEYVPDIAERRGPYREGHLAVIARGHEAGEIVMAGAVGDPLHSGLLIFRDRAAAEAFPARDPYIDAGLVKSWRVEPWAVVTPLP